MIIGYNIDRCKDIYRFGLRNFTDNALKMQVVSYFENKAIDSTIMVHYKKLSQFFR